MHCCCQSHLPPSDPPTSRSTCSPKVTQILGSYLSYAAGRCWSRLSIPAVEPPPQERLRSHLDTVLDKPAPADPAGGAWIWEGGDHHQLQRSLSLSVRLQRNSSWQRPLKKHPLLTLAAQSPAQTQGWHSRTPNVVHTTHSTAPAAPFPCHPSQRTALLLLHISFSAKSCNSACCLLHRSLSHNEVPAAVLHSEHGPCCHQCSKYWTKKPQASSVGNLNIDSWKLHGFYLSGQPQEHQRLLHS